MTAERGAEGLEEQRDQFKGGATGPQMPIKFIAIWPARYYLVQ